MRGKKPSTGEILQLFRTAGFDAFTPLQRKLIPVMLSGKDAVIQASPGAGSTAGFLIPLMLMLRGNQTALKALILVPDAAEIRKVALLYTRFSRVMRDPPVLFTIGDTEDARREQRRLERTPVMIVGTAERVIDHIRRGSVSFGRLTHVVVEQPRAGAEGGELAEDFVRDVQFIFAKLPQRRQTVLLESGSPGVPQGPQDGSVQPVGALLSFLRRPVPVSPAESTVAAEPPRDVYFEVAAADKEALLFGFIMARRATPTLVFHSPRTNGEALARGLCSSGIRAAALPPGAGSAARGRLFSSFFRGDLEVLLAPHPAPAECDQSRASLLIHYDLPPLRAATGTPRSAHGAASVVAFADRSQAKELAKFQDAYGVSMKKEDIPGRSDVVRGFMERILLSIKAGEDLSELMRLRALIRKQVPFLMRSYVSAYLLKSQLPRIIETAGESRLAAEPRGRQRGKPRFEQGQERAPVRGARPMTARAGAGVSAADAQRPQGRSGLIQLFVSIGRNRRVFPRDLKDFFMDRLKLRSDEIGSVRVFDKYSFVEISSARAEEAISRLSSTDFKGKTITVNYAKKKEEKEGS